MGNESRRSNDGKTNGSTTEVTESMGNSRDSRPTITASERALNGAILAAEISESYEEHLEIFDHFYADDIHATTDGLKEPVEGKAAVRARLAGFLVPLHVFAEIRGVSGSSCRVTWCSRRRWRAGRVLSEHHYDHHPDRRAAHVQRPSIMQQ